MMKKMALEFSRKKKKASKAALKEINKLSLKERKEIVIKELTKSFPNLERLEELLLMDNTNEDLLYRYIQSLKEDEVYYEIKRFSTYMSPSKINDIQLKFYGNLNQGFKNFSNKSLFFELLSAIMKNEQTLISEKLSIINKSDETVEMNNQLFDLNCNLEAFYYHISFLLADRIKEEKKNKNSDFTEYFFNLRNYVNSLSNELHKFEINMLDEKKEFKKFLTIVYSIINLDNNNLDQISQVPSILERPTDEEIDHMISWEEKEIKRKFGENAVAKFNEKIRDKTIFYSIKNIKYVNGEIEIPEKCYLYDYIIQNNVFKKYEKEIIRLLNIIYNSNLFKQLVRIIYKTENKDMKYYFEENNFVEDLWNNDIIFVPFKIKKVSGYSYKDTFKIFFTIYKIRHFDSEIEDEIFTLGAFIRVLIHETFGHLVISYIFYMYYANINKYLNYDTPKMTTQMAELNKKNLGEYIGNILANIFYDNLKEGEITFDDSFKKKLSKECELIIGKEYADKLIKYLEENQDKQISKIKNEDNLQNLSKEIVDNLISFISEEFNNYIASLDYKQEKYKQFESGNFVEFLIFNDFSQYMTLKDCLFLLDENNYNKNFFKFRSEFKNLVGKNNDAFWNELIEGQKIFSNLFSSYHKIYEKSKIINNDFNTPQYFRGNCGDNLIKKFEAFQCVNIGRKKENLMKKLEENS